ncbi:calpain-2 catalytic subunit-like [Myxocyprinus asiaticus]|uniref:calpain-2 catalytic subunit-like n=1 Tax=Myxocyprinus asiaticus TaxID=70543 RepID=UPI002222F3C6|nr:calpain-2 catalytic subunit-like [Myxocyprinus asiaticus]
MPPPRVNKPPRNEPTTKDEMGSLTKPIKFLDQDYLELLKNCFINKQRYVDEKFPPDSSSIDPQMTLKLKHDQVKWLRPSEIVADPQLIVEGVSRFDYSQGSVGNCWFLASVGALTFQRDIMDQVMPTDQSFSKDYAGIFHFKFWRFGKWIDVVIDDQLPTIKRKLIFVHSKTSNEFWPALLEKAYAKVCGSYADMKSGRVSEALKDFTGGVHIYYKLKKAPADLWNLMDRAVNAKALMGCSTLPGETSEHTLPNGIVQGHAYTVTGVFKVISEGNPVQLVRVLNPWGRVEWTGAWSDKSPLWNTVSAEERKTCQYEANDGEFWMSMEDYTTNFSVMDVCCLCPDFLDASSKCHWTSKYDIRHWIAGSTAGGNNSNIETFWTNPQFRLRIEELDKDCASGKCPENILVSLMQNREIRHRKELPKFSIGFYVYEIPSEMKGVSGKFSSKFFNDRKPIAKTEKLKDSRDVFKFFRLEPGEYLIVPCTLNPGETGSFVLSIFSKHETHLENIPETPKK